MEEERRARRPRERLDVGDVIAVVVRHDDCVDAARKELAAKVAEARRGDARPEAGVDEDARAVRLDEDRVSGRAAAQDEDAHGSAGR